MIKSIGIRSVGLLARFLLVLSSGLFLNETQLLDYNYIGAVSQVAAYIIGFELYQIVHRSYLQDNCSYEEKQNLLRGHFGYYGFALVLCIVIGGCGFYLGIFSSAFLYGLVSAFAFCSFMELYRYSGVLGKPQCGEVGYAVRGFISVAAVFYVYLQRMAASAEVVILICVVSDLLACAAIYSLIVDSEAKRLFFDSIKVKKTIPNAISLIRKNSNKVLPVVITAVTLRLITSIDKILIYEIDINTVSSKYFFASMLSLSIVGIFDSVYNNKVVPLLVAGNMNHKCFISGYRNIAIFLMLCLVVVGVFGSILPYSERFDYLLFLIFGLNYTLVFFSNSFHFILFSCHKDFINLVINIIPLIVIIAGFIFLNTTQHLDSYTLASVLLFATIVQAMVRFLAFRRFVNLV